jgi:DeoR family glycerol-3-phosphate regulon repressor
MLAEQRHDIIIKKLTQEEFVRSVPLSKKLGVSFETIRRDFEYLEQKKIIKRVHGGAVLYKQKASEEPFVIRNGKNHKEKSLVAQNALKLICDCDTISLDNGTTSIHLANSIVNQFKKLTVITSSLAITNILSKDNNITVIQLGGVLDAVEQSFYGHITENALKMFHCNKSFVSVSAISITDCISDFRLEEIPLQRLYLERSTEKYILADSGKFQTNCAYKICDIDDVTAIITDANISKSYYDMYTNAGYIIIK